MLIYLAYNPQISKLEKSRDSYLSEVQSATVETQHILKINKVIDSSKTAYNHLIILNSLNTPNSPSNCYLTENKLPQE